MLLAMEGDDAKARVGSESARSERKDMVPVLRLALLQIELRAKITEKSDNLERYREPKEEGSRRARERESEREVSLERASGRLIRSRQRRVY